MRSHTVSRVHLRVATGIDMGEWSDRRIWDALAAGSDAARTRGSSLPDRSATHSQPRHAAKCDTCRRCSPITPRTSSRPPEPNGRSCAAHAPANSLASTLARRRCRRSAGRAREPMVGPPPVDKELQCRRHVKTDQGATSTDQISHAVDTSGPATGVRRAARGESLRHAHLGAIAAVRLRQRRSCGDCVSGLAVGAVTTPTPNEIQGDRRGRGCDILGSWPRLSTQSVRASAIPGGWAWAVDLGAIVKTCGLWLSVRHLAADWVAAMRGSSVMAMTTARRVR
jgi:hypothetical protein